MNNIKLRNLSVNSNEKKQGYVDIYDTGIKVPVTLISGEKEGKTVLITAGVHGGEYPCIQTAIELAGEIKPSDIRGNLIIIHPINVTAFEKKANAVVPEDNKNLNRAFPGDKEGTLSSKLAHFLTEECQMKADFYLDLHGGDIHEFAMPFVYFPGIADEKVIEVSRKAAKSLDVKYMVKSGAKSGAYNYAAICGIPSLLLERGGKGIWSNEEVKEYKHNIKLILNHLGVISYDKDRGNSTNGPKEIIKAIYLESEYVGCWYPEVKAGDMVKKGEIIGRIKDFFGNTIATYNAEINGVILYMTVALSVEKNEPLIAYGEVN